MTIETWTPAFEDILRSHLPWCKPDTAIAPEAPLTDLGLDSLKTVRLLVAIEDAYALAFPDELLAANTFATAATLWSGIQAAATHCGVEIPA